MEEEKLFDTVKHVKADDSVRTCMEEYQRYLADTKLPHPVDGLKDVARRAIYIMNVRKEKIKFAQFIASVMEMHPHGDQSIQSAIERLFRTWDVRIPMIGCEGNIGSYTEIPGAPRYLDVFSSEFSRDMFFNGVHQSTIPMQYTIEYNSVEPRYFIPRLPNALLMGNLTIGLGFKSVMFPLNLEDVCILVQKYIEHTKHDSIHPFTAKGYEKHFIPDFPTFCYLRNEKDLLSSYSEGDFSQKVYTDGILDITKHTIVLKNIPALLPFSKVHEKLVEAIRQKSHWINDYIKDFKDVIGEKHHGSLKFIFKNNVDTWKVLPKIKQLVNFTSSLTPIYTYETEGKIISLTPPQILKVWYDTRYQSIINGLNVDQNALLKENMTIDAVLHVVDYKDKVVDIIKNADTIDSAIDVLSSTFDITKNQASVITKTALGKLAKSSKEELYAQKEDVKNRLIENNSKFSKVPDIIYSDVVYFRKKYSKPRRTLIPRYIGYVRIGDCGLYQYTTEDELFSIVREFTGTPLSIHQYKYANKKRVVINNSRLEDYGTFSIPRQTVGQSIEEMIADPSIYTLAHVGDTVSCVKGWVYPKGDVPVEYVSRQFIAILNNGSLVHESVENLSQRKSIVSGARSNIVYAIPYKKDTPEHVIAYMSTSPGYVNHLFLTKIWSSNGKKLKKLLTTPPHPFIVLDVVHIEDTGVIINLPKQCLNISVDHLYLTEVERLIGKDTTTINLRSGVQTLFNGEKVKPSRHPDCSSMVVI